MASTAEGRELTQAHQAAQIQVGARAESEAFALWDRLDINDLDGSLPYWLASTTIAVNRRMRDSQQLAATYLDEYRIAELGAATAIVLAAPDETARALRLAGPARVKRLIGAGMGAAEAYNAALTKFGGIVRRQTMMGGRLTVARTAGHDRRAVGWRRVTDGNPCAFCAMLASRGPVYKDAASADGIQYHAHCGCTAEPAYSYDWKPTADEDRYLQEYTNARYAEPNRSVEETLAAMRRNGSFRDSPK
jgi:hypothetical protein